MQGIKRMAAVMAAAFMLAGCGGGAGSPEKAIRGYTKAVYKSDRKGLKKYWWISEDKAVRRAVIDNKLVMNRYNDTLEKVAQKPLEKMIRANLLQNLSRVKPPKMDKIKEAVRRANRKKGDKRFAVFLPDTQMLYVGKHKNRWYVEHMFNAVNRTWTQKELKFMRAINDMYRKETRHIKKSRDRLQTEMGLRFFLMGVAAKQNKLMVEHKVPLVVGF